MSDRRIAHSLRDTRQRRSRNSVWSGSSLVTLSNSKKATSQERGDYFDNLELSILRIAIWCVKITHMAPLTTWQDIGARIGEARRAAGLTQDQLASHLEVDRSAVSRIESGTRNLGALELSRVAIALHVSVDHLLAAPPQVLSNRASLVDEDESDTGRSALRTQTVLSEWLSDVRQLVELELLPIHDLWIYDGQVGTPEECRQVALWVRRKLEIGNAPIESLVEACAKAGQWPLVAELRTDGASLVDDKIAVSVIDISQDWVRRRSTAAHELGHLVIGDPYSNDFSVHTSTAERERAIEAFAAELLLPSDAFLTYADLVEVDRSFLIQVSAKYGASWSLTLNQAELSGKISRSEKIRYTANKPTYAELRQSQGWRPQLDLDKIRVAPEYASATMEAYLKRLITRSRAVEMMHGNASDSDLPTIEDATY